MTYIARDQWEQHYSDGKGFRQVGVGERELLAEHTPAPDGGGWALDVGCGTGEMAACLASLGYTVDACDFAESWAPVSHACSATTTPATPRPPPAALGSSTLPSTKQSAASSPTSGTSDPTSSSGTTPSAS